MSTSGGSFGPDEWLYITGHDATAVYVGRIPSAGSNLISVATVDAPDIAGQRIARNRAERKDGSGIGTLSGIARESSEGGRGDEGAVAELFLDCCVVGKSDHEQ